MIIKNVSILDKEFGINDNVTVHIKADKICKISKGTISEDAGRIIDGSGKLLMSGFYNAHGHSPMTLMRGYGENMQLQDWLIKRIFPFEAKIDGNKVYWGTMLALAESFQAGIVSTSDMYMYCKDICKAVIDAQGKVNINDAVTNINGVKYQELAVVKEMQELYKEYNRAANGRILVDMGLHAEYTSNPETVRALAEYSKLIGSNMQVHVSETKLEHEACKDRHGMTPVQYFNKLGLFDSPCTAAHCVWIEGEDFDILKEKKVTVACNPISNLKLASGICDTAKLIEKGINVAIGTDSVASNNSLNFFSDIKTFALVAKVKNYNPTVVSPKEALTAGTKAGAMSQGRADCGSVEVGNKADLILLDLDRPNMKPTHDILNNLVYSTNGREIVMTIIDGVVVYENGRFPTIDIERVYYEVEKATGEIIQELRMER
ncbi:MAG: amidohydrolase [Anaerovoracaceae bacterium]